MRLHYYPLTGLALICLMLSMACHLTMALPSQASPTQSPKVEIHQAPDTVETKATPTGGTHFQFPDPFQLPNVSSMNPLSPSQGWVFTESLQLLWTEDGGSTWADRTPIELSVCPTAEGCRQIPSKPFFLSSSYAWLGLARGNEENPPTTLSVLRTEDGGRSWSQGQVLEFQEPLYCPGPACISGMELEFVDQQTGWLIGHTPLGNVSDVPYLFHTEDGGQSWSQLTIPIVGSLDFLDPLNGWAVGGETRWSSNLLLRTQDGGSSWEQVDLPLPEAFSMPGTYDFQLPVFSGASGLLPVRFYGGSEKDHALGFYTTSDGGDHWELTSTLSERALSNYGTGIPIPWSPLNQETWYIFLQPDKQVLTADKGASWEAFPATGLHDIGLIEVQFITDLEAWGLGLTCSIDSGCTQPLFSTQDGGRSWFPLFSGP